MAIKQSAWAKGNKVAVRPQTSGADHTQLFTYEVAAAGDALAANDIVEIGCLPPYAVITEAKIFTEGTFTGITADVGLMSGEYGSNDQARTSGNQLYAAVDLTTFTRLAKPESLLLARVEADRGIGVKVSGTVAAAAGKKIHLLLTYRQ